ncbi:MAG: hypothetical protein DWQ19_10080 [Crenarchaeota archaeon]|nr:MAG: hypothetical protein DWQ19_10080 [Thermoproteota archaeon]
MAREVFVIPIDKETKTYIITSDSIEEDGAIRQLCKAKVVNSILVEDSLYYLLQFSFRELQGDLIIYTTFEAYVLEESDEEIEETCSS